MPVTTPRNLSRLWVDRLASYRHHGNDEHLEALVEDALRFAGLRLEVDLSRSSYWSRVPLARRAAVLLFLVDRGVVTRSVRDGRRVYEVGDDAESWVVGQPALAPYLEPVLELTASLRREQCRRLCS